MIGSGSPFLTSRDAAVAVVGAGPAGLSVAACLRRRGVRSVVLERSELVGSTWRNAYDSLRLNTARWASGLPGARLPRRTGPWASRDDFVAYLDDYVRAQQLSIVTGVEVERVRLDGGLVLDTSAGSVRTPWVVIATGPAREPRWPDWPGRDGCPVPVLHSCEYRNAAPFRGLDVLVVGSGNTAADVAIDLTVGGASRVRVAVRTAPQIVPRTAGGVSATAIALSVGRFPFGIGDRALAATRRGVFGDLAEVGLPTPDQRISASFAANGVTPIIDAGFVDRVRSGDVTIVEGVVDLDRDGVLLQSGEHLRPDVVIAATGYRAALEPLVGHLGVLDERGVPLPRGPRSRPRIPGLHLVGFANPVIGNLRSIRREAVEIASEIAPADPYGVRWWFRPAVDGDDHPLEER